MTHTDRLLDTPHGRFAVRDYGGTGRDLLLVHGTGHNLEVWTPVAQRLSADFHVLAFDLRGHGLTEVDSTDAERYWRDIGDVAAALQLDCPVLVGHSTGAYAVTAHAAAGGACAGLVLLDGFVLDARMTAEQAAAWRLDREKPWSLYRYGWLTDEATMNVYIAQQCAQRDGPHAGVPPALIKAYLRRAFSRQSEGYVRRPTLDDLEAVCRNDPTAAIYPAREIYAQVRVPTVFVLAGAGPYAARRAQIEALAEQVGEGWFTPIEAGHNLHMQAPEEVAACVQAHVSVMSA
ncbi:alpha/beta fold hydrolase [Acidihalobacter ferrooxydans]|uniref:AB hydrolase-1 domain-containing protein n=1 Tax=Acidihalobacter ferrooxydans TaxID=1765967 RepID=A0A1P8UFQ4_9GAMM|nr:alpha/beta hydrolase [Acidihalobacter ferrooxydans]APZ42660.1 hypothetical protein BW247_05730 [Acidihalobacter ferrooxydans]